MAGGTLIVSREIKLHPHIKKRFETFHFENVKVTEFDKDGLISVIREMKPRIVIIGSAFYDCATPYMMKELLQTFPKLNIAALSVINSYPASRAMDFIFNGVRSYVSVLEGLDEFYHGIEEVRKGNDYISPEVQKHMEKDKGCRFTSENLTPKQIEVIRILGNGYTSEEGADVLGMSVRTFDKHKSDIYEILSIRNVVELTRAALFSGIIYQDELNFFPRDNEMRQPRKRKRVVRGVA